jgi:O-antigen/teichoic acid export membrane protein
MSDGPATHLAPPAQPHLRRLISDSAVYGLGGIASQALGILLVPIYARQLGVSNYGVLAVVNTTLSLTTMIATLALPQAFFRSYLKEARTDAERRSVLEATWGLRLVLSFGFALLFAALAVPLTALIFSSQQRLPLLLLIGPIVFFDTINLVPLSFLRGERRAGAYAALAFFRAIFGTILILVFVVVLNQGVLGVLIGSGVSAACAAGIGVAILARTASVRPVIDPRLWRYMVAFSLPLVPASVAAWTLSLSDRYIIGAVQGFQAVGIYAAGYTIGLVMNALVIQPFGLAWGAAYWEFAREANAPRIISRAMTLFIVVACIPALGLSLFGTDAMRLLLSPGFEPGRYVIPFSAFGYLCYGIYSIAATGINVASQTRWLPFVVAAAAIANLVVNLVGVPAFGYIAAAYSTFFSYGLLALLTGLVAQRYYPVPWDYARILVTLGLALGLTAVGILGPDTFVWRLLSFAAFPVAVLATRIVSRSDVARLTAWIGRRAGRSAGGRAA